GPAVLARCRLAVLDCSAPRSLRSSLVPRCNARSLSPRCAGLLGSALAPLLARSSLRCSLAVASLCWIARLRARSPPRSFLAAMLARCRLAAPIYADGMDAGRKREIEGRVEAGERLGYDDGVALYECDDLAWLGGLAHSVRTRKNGERVFFNVNRHLNLTNVCAASCAYCSFQRKPGEKA